MSYPAHLCVCDSQGSRGPTSDPLLPAFHVGQMVRLIFFFFILRHSSCGVLPTSGSAPPTLECHKGKVSRVSLPCLCLCMCLYVCIWSWHIVCGGLPRGLLPSRICLAKVPRSICHCSIHFNLGYIFRIWKSNIDERLGLYLVGTRGLFRHLPLLYPLLIGLYI